MRPAGARDEARWALQLRWRQKWPELYERGQVQRQEQRQGKRVAGSRSLRGVPRWDQGEEDEARRRLQEWEKQEGQQ